MLTTITTIISIIIIIIVTWLTFEHVILKRHPAPCLAANIKYVASSQKLSLEKWAQPLGHLNFEKGMFRSI